MGILSKKDYVCEKCGRTFQKRINLNGNICDECYNNDYQARKSLEGEISGYIDYARNVLFKTYNADEMSQIISHKNYRLNKFSNPNGINAAMLTDAGNNYKKLSNEQAAEIVWRIGNSNISSTMGAVYSGTFFVPTGYDEIIVDAADVFAVGYTSDYKLKIEDGEAILCAVFTNDPYVPVFPMLYVGKKGMFEMVKSKKGRESVGALFESMCPNLTYPVGDIKNLKKQIKQEGIVRGNVDMQLILTQISNASASAGIFDTKKMYSNLSISSLLMLDRLGYVQDEQVNNLLHLDKMFNRKFWEKQIRG